MSTALGTIVIKDRFSLKLTGVKWGGRLETEQPPVSSLSAMQHRPEEAVYIGRFFDQFAGGFAQAAVSYTHLTLPTSDLV